MTSLREQIIIDAIHLQPMLGRNITAMEFRRHGFPVAFGAGQASLQVTLSIAPHSSVQASEVFGLNSGVALATVFSGTISIPASPAPGPGIGIWDSQNLVRIPFQLPYAYGGGPLCVDIIGTRGQPSPAQGWTGDAVKLATDSTVIQLGPGAGGSLNANGENLFLDPDELVAGGRAKLSVYGVPNGIAIGFVGRPAVQPIPLSLVGIPTPGANAYLDEFYLSTFALLVPPPVPVTTSGMADWEVPLPSEPWMLGVTLAAQFIELTQSDVSNGIQWTVSSTMPTLGMAQISGVATEAKGERFVNVAHILRFEYTPP